MILIQFRMQNPPKILPPTPSHPRTARSSAPSVLQLLCSRHAGWRATRVRGRGRRGRRGSWRGLSLGVAPGCDAHDVQVHTPTARRRDRGPGTADAHAGPWTRVAAAGSRAAAHIAAHMMPSRPINPPTGSSRTPLGASSLVPSASPTKRRPSQTTRGRPRSDRRPRAGSRVPPGAAAQSLLYFSRCVVQGALAPRRRPRSFAPIATHRGRAEDRVRTERDLWPCW